MNPVQQDGSGGLYTKRITRKYQTGDVPGRYYGFSIGTGTPLEYDTTYYYDATGRLQRVQGPGLPTGPGAVYSFVANSDLVEDLRFKSGPTTTLASTTYTYEANRDVKTNVLNSKDTDPVTTISNYAYTLDDLGQRTSVDYSGTAFATAYYYAYGYNERSELDEARAYSGTPPTEINDLRRLYNYDNIGNRKNRTQGTGSGSLLYYCPDDLNRYLRTDDENSCESKSIKSANRGTPYLFHGLLRFPAWFSGREGSVQGCFQSCQEAPMAQRAPGSFVTLQSRPEIVGCGFGEESGPVGHHLQKRCDLDQPVILAGEMGGGAAPGVVLGTIDQAGPHGIPFDVTRGRQEVVVVEHE